MNRSLKRFIQLCTPGLLLAGLFIAGCADMRADPNPAYNVGMKQYNAGNYAEAAGSFRNATMRDPRHYKSHYQLARSYEEMNAYQQAIKSYRAALDTMNVTLTGRADEEFRQEILEGLARTIAKSDERNIEVNRIEQEAANSRKSEPLLILAKVYRLDGDPDTAIDRYNRAHLLDPNNFYIAKEYGLYLEQMGQTQQAVRPLQRAYQLNDKDPQVAAALRRLNVTPGPGLKDPNALAKPLVPEGPIPRIPMGRSPSKGGSPAPAAAPAPSGEPAQTPRD